MHHHYDPKYPDELEIKIMTIDVNFLDHLIALGQLDTKILEFECCGIISRDGSE